MMMGGCDANATKHRAVMQPHSQTVFLLLLNRLQAAPSTHFKQSFAYFMAFLFALDKVGPDFVIGILEGIQAG